VRSGLVWFNPSFSPDGGRIAFDSGFESPGVRVKLFDVRARTIKTISKPGRALPIFAGPTTIWAQQVKACQGVCLVPAELGSQVYAIDLRTGKERVLALRSLMQIDVLYG
jgi:hypothetical protein